MLMFENNLKNILVLYENIPKINAFYYQIHIRLVKPADQRTFGLEEKICPEYLCSSSGKRSFISVRGNCPIINEKAGLLPVSVICPYKEQFRPAHRYVSLLHQKVLR